MRALFSILLGLFVFFAPVQAQMLDFDRTEDRNSIEEDKILSTEQPQSKKISTPKVDTNLNITEEEKKEVLDRLEKANFRYSDGALKYNPVFDIPPTEDGSERGTTSFVSADMESDDAFIFMYINAIRMGRSTTLGTTCQVRFILANGLNKKVSNVSVKLVWPKNGMANLSFNDINPSSEIYLDYLLMGPSCYQLDKIPNIVVNRCRVKGMSQAACADKIRWLSKTK